MAINNQAKIIVLWIVFLLGLLFHTDLGLMPLFHNLSVAESQAQSMTEIAPILWLMLGFFILPMGAIIATLFFSSKSYRRIHFGLTLFYTLLNISHLIADLMIRPLIAYQIILMAILLMIGLLLNIVSYDWVHKF
jgi:hypothetical protein